MIALLMLAAVACALTAGAAAWAAEGVARLWRRPTRWGWAMALLAAGLAPVVAAAPRWRPAPPASARTGTPATAAVRLRPFVVRAGGALGSPNALRRLSRADRPLAVAWGLSSALALLALTTGYARMRRRARGWPRTVVDGVPVRVAPDLGPAVVGVRRTEIVLAEWTLAMDAPLRALVLRHEAEHVRGGDARLLAGAALLIAAMPWNAPLWWLAHRLRLALEVDCDARVLRAYPDVRRYGLLLLTVAQRAAALPTPRAPLAPAALAESLTDLERRIDVMRSPTPTHRLPRTALRAAAAALAVGAFAFACATPEAVSGTRDQRPRPGVLELDSMLVTADGASLRPPRGAPGAAMVSGTSGSSGAPRVMRDSTVYFEFQVERPVTQLQGSVGPRYPDSLRVAKVEGEVLAQFVVDTSGQAQVPTFKVLKSTHPLFVDAVRTALPTLRFTPAFVGGRAVRQLVQQPFQFALSQ
jgi:TonB family protein